MSGNDWWQSVAEIVLKPAMRLDSFVKLKYQSSTTILFAGIKYSVCDLLCGVNGSSNVVNSAGISELLGG